MATKSQNLLDYNKEELEALTTSLGQPRFRAAQLRGWLYRGVDFEEMTNLPETFRKELKENYVTGRLRIRRRLTSALDGTGKISSESWRRQFCRKRSDEI